MYKITPENNATPFEIALPENLIIDLVRRSEENGRDINTEIALRLARSLEAAPLDHTKVDVIPTSKRPLKKSKKR